MSPEAPTTARRGRWWALVVLAMAGLAGGSLMLIESAFNRMAFYPVRGIDPAWQRWDDRLQSITLSTVDGVELQAFWLPVADAEVAVLYLHGNAGNASDRLPIITRLAEMGVSVLLPDYRGYGMSEGSPSERGLYRDARAALDELLRRGHPPRKVVVLGRSLGGAVAVDLASEHPLAGVILCSTFSSASDMARAVGMGWAAPFVSGRLASIDKIRQVEAPLLFLHGTADEVVPHALGRRLHAAAPGRPTWVDLPATGHNDVTVSAASETTFWPAIQAFIAERGGGDRDPAGR